MGKRIEPIVEDEVVRLHAAGRWHQSIADTLGIGKGSVWRILKRRGVRMKRVGQRWVRCVDCGVATGGDARCKLHKRLRLAELWRAQRRKDVGIPRERWRYVEEWD